MPCWHRVRSVLKSVTGVVMKCRSEYKVFEERPGTQDLRSQVVRWRQTTRREIACYAEAQQVD